MDCVFCRITAGEIPSQPVYQDDEVLVLRDLNPQAPVHLLVIPKRHVASLADLTATDDHLLVHIHEVIRRLATESGLWPEGYRVVINNGPNGGQTVFHLHFHLLGGRFMGWPPG